MIPSVALHVSLIGEIPLIILNERVILKEFFLTQFSYSTNCQ